jgi:hypothetical protein
MACGLSFEGCYVLAPYLVVGSSDDVLYRHWAVLDLIALDSNPLEIFNRGVTKRGIHSSGLLCAFNLSLCESLLVVGDSVDVECKIGIFGVEVVESTLVHFELHVWLINILLVNDKHLVVTVVNHLILLDEITECDDVGNSILAKPNFIIISSDRRFMIDLHSAAIALEFHYIFGSLHGLVLSCRIGPSSIDCRVV